jgi:hypothetical protein
MSHYFTDASLWEIGNAMDEPCRVPTGPARRCAAAGCGTILRRSNPSDLCSLHDNARTRKQLMVDDLRAMREAAGFEVKRDRLPEAFSVAEMFDDASTPGKPVCVVTMGRRHRLGENGPQRIQTGPQCMEPQRVDVRRPHRRAISIRLCSRGCGNLSHRGCCKGVNHYSARDGSRE